MRNADTLKQILDGAILFKRDRQRPRLKPVLCKKTQTSVNLYLNIYHNKFYYSIGE